MMYTHMQNHGGRGCQPQCGHQSPCGCHNPCRPPCPPRPVCPPRPICPPDTVVPVVVECATGYRAYMDEVLRLNGPQMAVNVFPADFTGEVEAAEFVTEQMAVYNTEVIPLGGNQYRFTGTGLAFVYVEATGFSTRALLPIALSTVFTADALPGTMKFFALVVSSEMGNPVRVGRNLTVNLTLEARLLGLGDQLTAFPTVANFTCSTPPPSTIPSQCLSILESSYTASGTLSSLSQVSLIPLDLGTATAPYTVTDLRALDTAPIVISHRPYYSDTMFRLAYPVSLTLRGANGVAVPQISFVPSEYLVGNIPIPEGRRFIFDVRVQQIEVSSAFDGGANVSRLIAAGTISVIADASTEVLTTTLTQCADPVIATFEDDTPPRPD